MKEEEIVYCSICGEILTSKRSQKRGYGQRCGWKKYGRRTRTKRVSQGMPISDVAFKVSGGKGYVQLKIGDFE